MGLFQQLFKEVDAPKRNINSETIPVGEKFPFPKTDLNLETPCVVLLIWLHCRDCINILEELDAFSKLCDRQFQLYVIEATDEEIKEMVDYFEFDFPIVQITRNDRDIYKVQFMPYVYIINEEGRVESKERVKTAERMIEMIRTP